MKTHFLYTKYTTVLLCSILLLYSCSKKKELGPSTNMELMLTASASNIDIGEIVIFEVATGDDVIGADIYIDNNKISGSTHTFEKAGTFQSVAKKIGYKDSKAVQIIVKPEGKKVASATFSKKNIADYPTTFDGYRYDRIAISDNYLYVIENKNKEFRRYSLILNQWEDLASGTSLYSGIGGYLVNHQGENNKNILVYLGGGQGELNIYYPPEYPDASLKGSWVSQGVLPADGLGERGAASDGENLYYIGNSRVDAYAWQIDRYNPKNDYWDEKVARLPKKLDRYTQAVFADSKMFVVGHNSESNKIFMTYDLQTTDWKMKPTPSGQDFTFFGSRNNTLLVHQGYLIYMGAKNTTSASLYVFDIEADQWLNPVDIGKDLFSKTTENGSLLLSSSGKMYAAGSKAGDFVLYEVNFSVTQQ